MVFTSTDSVYTSNMMKRVNSIHESLKKREIFVLEKEKEVNSKMQLLGITKFNAMSLEKGSQIPTIFFITPTYKRLTQKADLTRLSQTLLHVPKLHWILVEDSHEKTNLVQQFLAGCGVQFSHLAVRTPKQLITKEGDPRWLKARGVEQRNLGLKWIRQNYKDGMNGVIYFGDDDNTYDLKIFEQVGQNWPIQFGSMHVCIGLNFFEHVVLGHTTAAVYSLILYISPYFHKAIKKL